MERLDLPPIKRFFFLIVWGVKKQELTKRTKYLRMDQVTRPLYIL